MISKNIFQTWKTKKVSDEFFALMDTWKAKNANYQYQLHDDEECLDFLKSFDRMVYRSYLRILPGAFKADLWRYCVLFEFGGFYCDVDTICLGGIDEILFEDTNFVAAVDLNPGLLKHNLFNAFIGAERGSRIMQNCIERIVENVSRNTTSRDMHPLDFSACGILGRSANDFLGREETESFVGKEGKMGSVNLLKFCAETEVVSDVRGSKLFQNKNGSQEIQFIYNCSGGSSWARHNKWVVGGEKIFL